MRGPGLMLLALWACTAPTDTAVLVETADTGDQVVTCHPETQVDGYDAGRKLGELCVPPLTADYLVERRDRYCAADAWCGECWSAAFFVGFAEGRLAECSP